MTDDVLLLFDALFDHFDVLGALQRDYYADCQNLPYTHGLDDAALDRTVEELVRAGLLAARVRPRGGTWYGLTEAGGRLWEIERAPDWQRFLQGRSWLDDASGEWQGAIWVLRASTAEAYLRTARRCGLRSPDAGCEAPVLRRQRRLLPWKTFDRVYEFRLRPPVWPEGSVDWGEYERNRTWWGHIGELATLAAADPETTFEE